jgi:hypothetical protein
LQRMVMTRTSRDRLDLNLENRHSSPGLNNQNRLATSLALLGRNREQLEIPILHEWQMSVHLSPDGQKGVGLDKKIAGRNRGGGEIEQGERKGVIGSFRILSTLSRVKHCSRYRSSTLNVDIIWRSVARTEWFNSWGTAYSIQCIKGWMATGT